MTLIPLRSRHGAHTSGIKPEDLLKLHVDFKVFGLEFCISPPAAIPLQKAAYVWWVSLMVEDRVQSSLVQGVDASSSCTMSVCVCRASYLCRWLLWALLFLAAALPSTADCPKSCACNVPTEVHCTFRYLTTVPDHIQPAVERINLGYNSVTMIRENDLLGLQDLELLMLHSNTIHSIEDRAFNDLKSLQVLKMSFNKVKTINKDTFKGLDSILRLHIDHNHIEFIHPEAFYGLTNLQLVHLEGNRLQQLHPDTFITLRHSQVFKVSSVRSIHLSDNLLTTLPAEIFSGCSQLENLFLHGNPWTCDCRMRWFSDWTQSRPGVLKCKRDRRYPSGQLCPVCETPAPCHNRALSFLQSDAFTCTKPWIDPQLKQKNISLDEGNFTPVSPKDFIAPLGSIQMNLTDQFYNDASLFCTVQRPTAFEDLMQTVEVEEGNNVTVLTAGITTYLVCNIDHEHIQQLWQILATYSDSRMRLERGLMLARSPEMVFRYSQIETKDGEEEVNTNIEADIKASPAWLMQGEVSFQLDRTSTTFSTLHIKYQSAVNLRLESTPKKDRYSWTMIKRDNQTKTQHIVLTGGVAQLTCQVQGEPKPLLEWILPDGSKVRAPYSSEDRRIIITAEGKLSVRGADASDTGLYWCIATNYLDADILTFRVTVLSPDVEEADVNGVQLSQPLGGNLVFNCGSSGSPEPSMSWILPDHSILDKSNGNRLMYENGTLLIQDLTERDRGFYRCLVANDLGVDLLVSQATVTEGKSAAVLDSDRSGMESEVLTESSLTEDAAAFSEIPSSNPADRTGQESRTLTSDRPYPRQRSQGRGSSGGRLGQRRKWSGRSRNTWSGRVFDKASRKVDPLRFAEFVKKAQSGSREKSDTNTGRVQHENSHTGFSGEPENGSGEGHEDYLIVVTKTIKPTTNDLPRILVQDKPSATATSTQTIEDIDVEHSSKDYIHSREISEHANMPTNDNYMQSDSTSVSMFTDNPRFVATTESDNMERVTKPPSNINPITLQLTVTDTSQETQIQFSGEPPSELETSTEAMLSLATDPNVTPMKDGPGPVELVIHTDPESQTTFTAITTTERQQDEITFHTTQTIKSPRLPAGSTIISRQQIHIIPRKNGRGGGGGRRSFQGRRRIVKPNRITDIQSFINKLKQPTIKKEGNTTVPYRIELTTDCGDEDKKKTMTTNLPVVTPTTSSSLSLRKTARPATTPKSASLSANRYISPTPPFTYTESRSEIYSEYITSADVPEFVPTLDPLTTKKVPVFSTTTTTAASKVIRGRIPWNRLFGGQDKEHILGRLKRPFITAKPRMAAKTTTMSVTTAAAVMPTTTANSLAEPETLSPFRHTVSKESSIDDDYEDVTSADFEFTTHGPSFHAITATSPSSTTTAETPTELQTIPSPPTIKPNSVENVDDSFSSGSGGLPDQMFVIKQRPGGTKGWQGRRRRPFGGRGPFRKPGITKKYPTTTTEPPTTKRATVKNAMEVTTQSQPAVSLYNSLYTSSEREDRITVAVSNEQISEEENDLYDELVWTPSLVSTYKTTKQPLSTSTTFKPTTRRTAATTKRPYTTARTQIHNNVRPPTQRSNAASTQRTPTRLRPTVQSSRAKGSADKRITFDTINILTSKEYNTNTPDPYNKDVHNAISTVYNDNIQVTGANVGGIESTTKVMTSKPKIVGGNAASFTVLSDSDAFLPCESAGNPQPLITWKRFVSSTGNTITIKGRMGKFEVLSNGTLSIQNANIKDRGQYICLAENDYGSDKLIVTLSVVAYPSRILEPKMREIKTHAGHTVELACNAEGRPMPMISWILANQTQVRGVNTERGRASVSSEGTLVIENVSVYDRGHYKCIASNPAGADTATVRLQVVAAPPGIAEEKRQYLKASASHNLWLPCTGHGSPQPTIHWVLFDGSVVRSDRPSGDSRMLMFENGTLHIKSVTPEESGKYECIATSSTGSERRVVTLTVEMQQISPQIVEKSKRMTDLFYGDRLMLNCSATGDPKPRIIWRLPSKAVVDQWHRTGSRIEVLENGTLVVNSMSDKDAGDYLCVARSKIGDDLQLMKVSVSMKPAKIEPKVYGKKNVPYGNDLKVDCKATGAPKPEISWGLPDGTVVNSALQSDASGRGVRARRYTLFNNGTLYLNQVGMSEEGAYTCYAENQVGKDEMHVHITIVTAPPKIRPPSQTHIREKPGGNIRFDCEAIGEPKPKILWMLPTNDVIAASNDRYLMHVNGSLDIRDVKPGDAGDYVCMARNPGGESRGVYTLEIDGNPPVINGYHQNRTVIKDVAPKHSRKLLHCKAEGNPSPSVTWIMPDNIFLPAPYFGSRINVHHNGTLDIHNVRPTDTAEFICLARNDGGEAVLVVQLEVTGMLQRPIFKNPFNERMVSRHGKSVVLNCSADGNPMPEIIWILPNGTRFTGIHKIGSHHETRSDGTLLILNPRKEDAGKYRCGAKNSMGYIEKLIIVDIGEKPYILTRPRGIIRTISGEPLFLHCLSDGSPKPRIYWTIPGGHTLTRPQILGRYQLLENGTLIVHDTTLHDRGNYICRARNEAGEAGLTVPVVIIGYPPKITTGPPPNVRVVAGTPIQLSCFATGIPKPEITWELPNHAVLAAAEQGPQTGTELIIQRATTSDSGTYQCLAKNHLGTDSKIAYVLVL